MVNSPAKLLKFLEEIQDLDDHELAEAIPMVSARVIRGGLAAAARVVPADHQLLDHYLQKASDMLLAMRSDHLIEAAAAAELEQATP